MKISLLTLLSFLLITFINQAQENKSTPDYLNPDLPVEVRVNDIVSRMTLEEKVSQMLDGAKPIERLEIPEYNWWNECLHGVARAGTASHLTKPSNFLVSQPRRFPIRLNSQ